MLHGMVSVDIKLLQAHQIGCTQDLIRSQWYKFNGRTPRVVMNTLRFIKGKGRQSEILVLLCACARLALVLVRTMIRPLILTKTGVIK